MTTTPKWVAAAALSLATVIVLAGCSAAAPAASSTPGAKPSGAITVYNAQHEELTQAWADEFTKETGVTVTLRNGDDSELGNQLVQEGSASPADVFLTENSPAMSLVDNAKLFAPVDAPLSPRSPVPIGRRPATGPALPRAVPFSSTTRPCSRRPSCRHPCWTWRMRSGRAGGRPHPRVPIFRPS